MQSVNLIKGVLDDFASVSGLTVSTAKSDVLIGGVSEDLKALIFSSLGMKEGSLPFRYLGVPISSRRLKFANCKSLVDRILARILN